MEKQLKGYIFRIYPNQNQKQLINKSFGVNRFIYNYFLEKSKTEKMNAYTFIKQIPELTKQYEWLKEVDSCLLRTSIFDLDNAYQKHYKEQREKPKFKSKNRSRSRNSYRTNNIVSTYKKTTYESIKLDLEKRMITLPKLKEMKIRGYQKLKNVRKYYLHSISRELTEEHDIVVTEKLKIAEMIKKKSLSKSIYDASWNKLLRQLEYKTKWKGKQFYQIETYYPSSQICNHCGHRNKKLKDLKIRNWICEECKSELERDLNASINIMFEGIKKYMKELEVS